MSSPLPDPLLGKPPSALKRKKPSRLLRRLLRKEDDVGVNASPGIDDGWTPPERVTLADGSMIRLFKDGEALKHAYDAIASAQSRVCFEFYIWDNDATGRAFADLLKKKAREGVNVYCIYDGWGVLGGNDRRMFKDMREHGVRVAEFHPIRPWETTFSWKPFARDHRKVIVVDDKFAGVGGLNIADPYAGSWVAPNELKPVQLWRDTAIGVEGPASKYFLGSFARTWNYIHKGGRIVRAMYTGGIDVPHLPKGYRMGNTRLRRRNTSPAALMMPPDSLGVIATTPTLASKLRPVLHSLLRNAQRTIRMTMAYFAPDDELVRELCDAAARGVKVQLMFGAKSDLPIMVTAARAFYDRLLCSKIEIYERQHVILHAKTMIVDDVSIVGSTNLDYRSIEFNCEISAIVRSEAFAKQLHTLFEHDMRYAKRVDDQVWRKRKFLDRAIEWTVIKTRQLL